jgi:hypothetical protein
MPNIENWEVASIDDAGTITADGGFVGDITGSTTGVETTYIADGAIALTNKVAILTATAASTDMTLADGTIIGQELIVACDSSINSATVTLATPVSSGSDVITFTSGDLAIFRWTSAGWGAVQGITAA